MAIEKKNLFIEKLDTGFILTGDSGRSAVEKDVDLKNVIKIIIDRMLISLNSTATHSISISIEVEVNPAQVSQNERA